jgi:hypothetical protein
LEAFRSIYNKCDKNFEITQYVAQLMFFIVVQVERDVKEIWEKKRKVIK